MTGLVLPSISSTFAIYTVEEKNSSPGGKAWDLHATAYDRTTAISHARMLALQPGVTEVYVKQISENPFNGVISVRDIKHCRRGWFSRGRFSWFFDYFWKR